MYSRHTHFRKKTRRLSCVVSKLWMPTRHEVCSLRGSAIQGYLLLPATSWLGPPLGPCSPHDCHLYLSTPAAAVWPADVAVSKSKFAQAIYPSLSRAPQTEDTDIHLNYKSPPFTRKKNKEFGFHAGKGLIDPDLPEHLQPKLYSGCGRNHNHYKE